MIHLEEPGNSPFVDKNVKAENLKAHVVVDVTGLRSSVVMDEIRLYADERFDDHVSHHFLDLFYVETVLSKLHPDAVEASLVPGGGFGTLISHVISIILINCIICQMYKRIIISFLFVLFARKSCQSVFIHIDS